MWDRLYAIIGCRGGSRISSYGVGALKKIAPSGRRRESFWGISCEKSRTYAKKSYFFQFWGGGGAAPPPWIRPWVVESFVYLIVPKSVQGGSERNAVKDVDKNEGK
jgi:hypothetical protein